MIQRNKKNQVNERQRTWQQMDVRKRDVQNGDEQLVCERIYKAAKSWSLIGKVPSDKSIQLLDHLQHSEYNQFRALLWSHVTLTCDLLSPKSTHHV